MIIADEKLVQDIRAMLHNGMSEARIRDKLSRLGTDVVSVGEAFTAIRMSQIIDKPSSSKFQVFIAFMLGHPYLIALAGLLFFSALYFLEGNRGAALAVLMGLALIKIILYAVTIYILDLMFQTEQHNIFIYAWISIPLAACSVVPYSGWVFQAVILYFWLKEDLRRVMAFLLAVIALDLAFSFALVPVFLNMVGVK
jgi:hypothetical protein